MKTNIQSIHFDASEQLQAFVEKKTAKLEKFFDEIDSVEVTLKVVKPETAMNKQADIRVSVKNDSLFASKVCDTFEESVDQCVDALRIQLEKYKEKLRGK
ncbi:MAG: ribosome-associated translation inhibitor RaiA [Bacteroidaceae bacterium]|nr:ribosome-associated translation inhibitor RaiA [Bacteroidaceae bacterium]